MCNVHLRVEKEIKNSRECWDVILEEINIIIMRVYLYLKVYTVVIWVLGYVFDYVQLNNNKSYD